MVSFILPGNSASGEYEVANSCRFDDGSSDYLSRTVGAGNRQTWTWSGWIKRSTLGTDQCLFDTYVHGNDQFRTNFADTDRVSMRFYNGTEYQLGTTRKFRDTSAWVHLVFVADTTNSTEADRFRIYVNGVRETALSDVAYPTQNLQMSINDSNTFQIGRRQSTNYFDGYMAEVVFIDGTALDADSFGEFDEDSPTIWKPKDVSGLTFGTNGFHLDFEDSSSLGNDAAGSNNFSVSNLTSVDQSTDTCTNNFATLNPLNIDPGDTNTFSEGNLKCVMDGEGTTSTIAMTSGKWYMEYKVGSPTTNWTGVQEVNALISDSYTSAYSSSSIYIGGATVYLNGSNNSGSGGYGSAWSSGDIGMIAFDADNERVYFGKGGSWWSGSAFDSATPATYIQLTNTGHDYYFRFVKGGNTSCTYEVNFGSPSFSISSGNSDGNGYGNFEYSVPSGYYALNTKNLAEYG